VTLLVTRIVVVTTELEPSGPIVYVNVDVSVVATTVVVMLGTMEAEFQISHPLVVAPEMAPDELVLMGAVTVLLRDEPSDELGYIQAVQEELSVLVTVVLAPGVVEGEDVVEPDRASVIVVLDEGVVQTSHSEVTDVVSEDWLVIAEVAKVVVVELEVPRAPVSVELSSVVVEEGKEVVVDIEPVARVLVIVSEEHFVVDVPIASSVVVPVIEVVTLVVTGVVVMAEDVVDSVVITANVVVRRVELLATISLPVVVVHTDQFSQAEESFLFMYGLASTILSDIVAIKRVLYCILPPVFKFKFKFELYRILPLNFIQSSPSRNQFACVFQRAWG
jgi:hypothetical protein